MLSPPRSQLLEAVLMQMHGRAHAAPVLVCRDMENSGYTLKHIPIHEGVA